MARRSRKPGNPHRSAMALAVAAVEGRPNPLDDRELAAVDPAPTSLDLPDDRIVGRAHSANRCAGNTCIVCGQPHCQGCGVA